MGAVISFHLYASIPQLTGIRKIQTKKQIIPKTENNELLNKIIFSDVKSSFKRI